VSVVRPLPLKTSCSYEAASVTVHGHHKRARRRHGDAAHRSAGSRRHHQRVMRTRQKEGGWPARSSTRALEPLAAEVEIGACIALRTPSQSPGPHPRRPVLRADRRAGDRGRLRCHRPGRHVPAVPGHRAQRRRHTGRPVEQPQLRLHRRRRLRCADARQHGRRLDLDRHAQPRPEPAVGVGHRAAHLRPAGLIGRLPAARHDHLGDRRLDQRRLRRRQQQRRRVGVPPVQPVDHRRLLLGHGRQRPQPPVHRRRHLVGVADRADRHRR